MGGGSGDRGSEEDHQGDGLTDLDCYAVLSSGGLGGKNGYTLQAYLDTTDRQILALLSVEWDEEGNLVKEASRGRSGLEATGLISQSLRELPPPESLGIENVDFALNPNVPAHYTTMFWSVWSKRGKSPEEIRELYRKHLASPN